MTMTAPTQTQTPTQSAGGRLIDTEGRELPLRAVSVSTEAGGGIARVVLTQRFANPSETALEVRYLLPLPSDGAVSGFAFTLGGQRIEGEVTGKAQARERFERALVQGKTAALLEQDRSSLFTQRVGNVPPGAEILCEVVIDQPLRWLEEGCWEWRFPTVVGARYQGEPGRVADAGKLSVPVAKGPLGLRASLSLELLDAATGAPVSPSHALEPTREGALRFEGGEGVRLDRDIVVRWPVALPDVSAKVLAARPERAAHAGDTFALLTVAPPCEGGLALARDLTFLIDTSGSMGGRPLEQAAEVLGAMIETLGPEDRIELIEFGSSPVRWKPEPVAATPAHKAAAIHWIRSLRASGCTEMHRAVLEALRPLRANTQRQVVLVTDGYIGFEQEIVATLLRELPDGARLHTIGVGSSVNRTLTQGAARAGRGTELIIGLGEDPAPLAARLLARTTAPLVTDLRVSGPGVLEVAPRQIPDLYAETPAMFAVRLGPEGGQVTLRGQTASGPWEKTLSVPPLALGQGPAGVAALFGREKVEDLEMALSGGGSSVELNAAIEAVGVDFQIATRLTSWVAVSKAITVAAGTPRSETEQPHELPHGVSAEGLGLRQAAPSAGAGGASFSRSAVASGFLHAQSLEEEAEEEEDMNFKLSAPRARPGRALWGKKRKASQAEDPVKERRPEPAKPAPLPSAPSDPGPLESREELSREDSGDDEGGAPRQLSLVAQDLSGRDSKSRDKTGEFAAAAPEDDDLSDSFDPGDGAAQPAPIGARGVPSLEADRRSRAPLSPAARIWILIALIALALIALAAWAGAFSPAPAVTPQSSAPAQSSPTQSSPNQGVGPR